MAGADDGPRRLVAGGDQRGRRRGDDALRAEGGWPDVRGLGRRPGSGVGHVARCAARRCFMVGDSFPEWGGPLRSYWSWRLEADGRPPWCASSTPSSGRARTRTAREGEGLVVLSSRAASRPTWKAPLRPPGRTNIGPALHRKETYWGRWLKEMEAADLSGVRRTLRGRLSRETGAGGLGGDARTVPALQPRQGGGGAARHGEPAWRSRSRTTTWTRAPAAKGSRRRHALDLA